MEERKQQCIVRKVSTVVWESLRSDLPEDSKLSKFQQLDISERGLRERQHRPDDLCNYVLVNAILDYQCAWSSLDIDRVRSDITANVAEILRENRQSSAEMDEQKHLKKAFCSTYFGDADVRFQRHLLRCCKRFYEHPNAYTAPCVTLIQSSGFGKTRMLFKVAKKLAQTTTEHENFDMRLMYVCARNVERSTSTKFPVATPCLSEFFFQDTQIGPRSLTTLEYACANWESVKTDWIGLFGVGEEGQEVTSKKRQRSPGATTDETLASELRRIIVGEVKNQEPSSKKSRGSSGSVGRDGSVKVLVLVIDEAASLLEKKTCNGSDHLSMLRKALTEASNILQVKKRKAMILAVLVDSNPEIINTSPSSTRHLQLDYSLRDPFLRSCSLKRWASSFTGCARQKPSGSTTKRWNLRATEESPVENKSYGDESLYGVASMLCRLGLRPQSNSELAPKLVAELMAVLDYVDYKGEFRICGYVSEPILTFAATHVWYEGSPLPLEAYILPELQDLLMKGNLDVDDMDDVVARIVLLLAMDATIRDG